MVTKRFEVTAYYGRSERSVEVEAESQREAMTKPFYERLLPLERVQGEWIYWNDLMAQHYHEKDWPRPIDDENIGWGGENDGGLVLVKVEEMRDMKNESELRSMGAARVPGVQ